MFNLLVSANDEYWGGNPVDYDLGRCIRKDEYTDDVIAQQLGDLSTRAIETLLALPAVFAYEESVRKAPRFGKLTGISKRPSRGQVRLEYQLIELPRFLTNEELWAMDADLDLGRWESSRTHWAVKAVDLGKELHAKGIVLPPFAFASLVPVAPPIDVTTHVFDVGFSFPGEHRPTVEAVAHATTALLGPHSCFYDENYQAQLARPALDTLLQDLYGRRALLLVVFIGADYQRKHWPNLEWAAIRSLLMNREHARIMYVRMDEGQVDGVFAQDGFIDARRFTPQQIASFISERVAILKRPRPVAP